MPSIIVPRKWSNQPPGIVRLRDDAINDCTVMLAMPCGGSGVPYDVVAGRDQYSDIPTAPYWVYNSGPQGLQFGGNNEGIFGRTLQLAPVAVTSSLTAFAWVNTEKANRAFLVQPDIYCNLRLDNGTDRRFAGWLQYSGEGAQNVKVEAPSTYTSGEDAFVVLRHTYGVGDDLFINGELVDSYTNTNALIAAVGYWRVCAYHNQYMGGAAVRAWSDAEIRKVSQNPYGELLERKPKRLYFAVSSGLPTLTSIAASNLTSSVARLTVN